MPKDAVGLIDAPLLRLACPNTSLAELALWVEPIKAACSRYGLTSVRRVASFIGQCAIESEGFTRLVESLNYSVEGLLAEFSRQRISEADCHRYGRTATQKANQEAIANIIYGGDFGRRNLGNVQPGDGWRFIGRGPIMNTGRANREAFAREFGMTTDDATTYLMSRAGGAMAAGLFFVTHHVDKAADTPGWVDDTKAVNGGDKALDRRTAASDAIVAELLKRGA